MRILIVLPILFFQTYLHIYRIHTYMRMDVLFVFITVCAFQHSGGRESRLVDGIVTGKQRHCLWLSAVCSRYAFARAGDHEECACLLFFICISMSSIFT